MIESAITAALGSDAALAAAAGGISHGLRNQGTPPPVVFFEVDQDEALELGADPLRSAFLSIVSVAETMAAALDLAEVAKAAAIAEIDGTVSTTTFSGLEYLGRERQTEDHGAGEDLPAAVLDRFRVLYREA